MVNDEILKIEIQNRFDELMKARSGYYKDNPKNRHLGRVGIPYGSNKKFIDEELIKFNDRFNEELDRYKNGEMKVNEVIHLGKAKGILAKIVPNNNPIILRQRVISKGIRKKHNVDVKQIKNLPILISDPLMIFKRKEGDSYSVLIRAKDNDNKNIFVAVHLNQDNPSQQDRDKGILIVDDIKSFHEREMENIISPIVENKSLVWVNKKDSLELLSSAKSTPQYNDIQDYLSDAVNIVRKFENTNEKDNELNIIKGKIEDEQLLNQIVDEIIEKAKKGSPIGTEKTWGGKVYVKTELVG